MGILSTFLSILVVLVAIFLTIFTNYPSPPPSPILFQWKDNGHTFKYKEYEIFYIDEIMDLNSTKPALLCLHGFPTSSFDYYKMYPELRRKFDRIVFIDFLGLGFSSKPRFKIYTIFEQAKIVEQVINHINVNQVHLLAHDYGDTVAQELIASQNENNLSFQIVTASLMNGGVFPEVYEPLFVQRLLRFPVIGTMLGRFHNYYTFRYHLTNVFGPNTQPTTAELHDFWSIIRQNDGFRVFSHLLNYMEERQSFASRWVDALKKTSIPIQMIYGPFDPINPEHRFVPYFRNHLPGQRLDVLAKEIGHYPNLEAPSQVVSLLVDFLAQHNFHNKN